MSNYFSLCALMHKACSGCPAPRLILRARLAIALGKPRAWEHAGKENPGAPSILIKLSPRRSNAYGFLTSGFRYQIPT